MPDVRPIDANALLRKLREQQKYSSANDSRGRAKAILEVIHAPTVDAQPVKRGEWERTDMFVKCSECGVELLDDAFFGIHVFDDGYMPYCPNCGAKMKMN